MLMIDAKTRETLAKTIEMTKEIDQLDKSIQVRYKRMSKGLWQGMDGHSIDQIELYRPQLVKVIDDAEKCLAMIQVASALLRQLRGDETLMESRFETIEQLVGKISEVRTRLVKQISEARYLDDQAERASGPIAKGYVSAEADLGALKNQVETLMKTIRCLDDEAPGLADAAKKAHAKGDMKKVTESRLRLLDFQKHRTAAMAIRPRIEKYKSQYPDISREQKAELQWLLDDLQRADDSVKGVEATVKELLALKAPAKPEKAEKAAPMHEIPKAPLKKAAAALGIADKDLAKLARILNEQSRTKWPDALAKLAGQLELKDAEGKAMAQKIDKIEYFRKQTLIDI